MVVQETVSVYPENTLGDASQKNKASPSCAAVSGSPAFLGPPSSQVHVVLGRALEGMCK